MNFGFLTCEALANLSEDDRLAVSVLESFGHQVIPVLWGCSVLPADLTALVIRSPWDYYERAEAFSKWLGKLGVPLLNPLPTVLNNLNKNYLLGLEKRGISIVPSLVLNEASPETLAGRIAALGWNEIVIKPAISGGSDQTYRLRSTDLTNYGQQLSAIIERCEILIQPYLQSIETDGEVSLIYFKSKNASPVFSHAVHKTPTSGDFRVQPAFGGVTRKISPSARLLTFAEKCLSAIDTDWLYARVDIVNHTNHPLLSEIELIEPNLFFSHHSESLLHFANSLLSYFPIAAQ